MNNPIGPRKKTGNETAGGAFLSFVYTFQVKQQGGRYACSSPVTPNNFQKVVGSQPGGF